MVAGVFGTHAFAATAAMTIPIFGAVEAQPSPPSIMECLDYVGYLELTRNRNVRFTYYPPVNRTLTIRRTEKAYPAYIAMMGDAGPGERKYLLKMDGTVRMNPDRTLDVTWNVPTRGKSDLKRKVEILRPGDPAYDALIERVEGLQPGKVKAIPTRSAKCRKLGPPP